MNDSVIVILQDFIKSYFEEGIEFMSSSKYYAIKYKRRTLQMDNKHKMEETKE